mgnify:CR=1 FL=1
MIKKIVKKLIPHFLLDFYYWLWALAGALFFAFPSRKLIVIGVTGTSGKSTTVDFITRILEENGERVASLSSIRFKIADEEKKNNLKMTMPGRLRIQQFLCQAVCKNCKYAVLEVTSEGIRQFRHKFINFDTVVFNNLSPEHIESHGGFENYRNEKLKLFHAAKNVHVINVDDENAKYFLETPAKEKVIFSFENPNDETPISKQYPNENFKIISAKKNSDLEFEVENIKINLNVLGNFNQHNALAAISVAQHYGVSLEICKKALEKVSAIPGRMEVVARDPFLVVVDYAHTPEQLKQVYQSLGGKNLVCVLGSCGGGRDKWKRPVLGTIAGEYCKEIIITNEDPYDEDPLEIMEQVASQIEEGREYHIVIDRKEAIKKALELAKPEDTVIITGKGSEPLMCLAGGKKIPWSDREIVKEELLKLK